MKVSLGCLVDSNDTVIFSTISQGPDSSWTKSIAKGDVTAGHEREMLEKIMALTPYAISIWDSNGHFLVANRAFCGIFGAATPPSHSMLDNQQVDVTGLQSLAERLREGEVVIQPEIRLNPHDAYDILSDHDTWTKVVIFSIPSASGKQEFYVCMYDNISERRRAELELTRLQNDRYEQIRTMAGGMAHEIYNALFRAKTVLGELMENRSADGVSSDSRIETLLTMTEQSIARAMQTT
jgi:hypothetical protein